jgi:hypothetical protein
MKMAAALASGIFLLAASVSTKAEAPKEPVSPEQLAREIQSNTQFLAGKSLAKAKTLLEAYDDFAPFGAALLPNGEVKFVWAIKPGELAKPETVKLVLNSIRRALRAQADEGRILGSAVIYRYRPAGGEKTEQVNMELEYLTGFAQVLATEYGVVDGKVQYEEGATQPYDPLIFPTKEGS